MSAKIKKSKDKSARIVAKATSWRFFATCDTILLSWLFTGAIGSALKIGASEVVTKIGLFYLHERLWERFNIGLTVVEGEEAKEKHWRSLVKGISWRFFGTMDTIMLALFWTGDFKKAFAIGITEVFTKVALFWLHERAWMKIKWGKKDTQPVPVSEVPAVETIPQPEARMEELEPEVVLAKTADRA